MHSKSMFATAALTLAMSMVALTAANAGTILVDLGASAENFTLYGMGETYPGSGVGTFTSSQGSGSYDGTNSTFVLSGAITGGTPGYDSGTYEFITSYAGTDAPNGGPNALVEQSNPANTNQFYYTYLSPSSNVMLDLFTPGGDYSEALVTDGNFVAGTGFSFTYISTTCTGVAVCGQNNVGITPAATIFGPVTTQALFTVPNPVSAAPEPGTWALMFGGLAMIGGMLRIANARRRENELAGIATA